MKKTLYTAALAASLAACTQAGAPGPGEGLGAGSGSEPGGGEADPAAAGPNLKVLLTDAPGDFDEVWVNIAEVQIESADAGWITLTEGPQQFDLLTLQNDVTAALGGGQLAPGMYGQLRLIVDDAHVVADGISEDLKIASGAQTGIKINLDATIEENMVYTLVIDFDAAKSVKSTGQGWLMTPVIKVKELSGVPVPVEEEGGEGEADAGTGDDTGGDTGDDTGGDTGDDTGGDTGDDTGDVE